MNKLVQYSAKLSLAGAVALAWFVLGGTSIFAPALADHELGHDEVARGKIGALEERVWNCENQIAPCERKGQQGAEGSQGSQGSQGPPGPQGQKGAPGVDGAFAGLECTQGQRLISDANGDWICS